MFVWLVVCYVIIMVACRLISFKSFVFVIVLRSLIVFLIILCVIFEYFLCFICNMVVYVCVIKFLDCELVGVGEM